MSYLKQINVLNDSEEMIYTLLKDNLTKEYVKSHEYEEIKLGNRKKSTIKPSEVDHLWNKKQEVLS